VSACRPTTAFSSQGQSRQRLEKPRKKPAVDVCRWPFTKILQPATDQRSSGRLTWGTSITKPTNSPRNKTPNGGVLLAEAQAPSAPGIVREVVSVRPFQPLLAGTALSAIETVTLLSSEA